MLVSVPWKKSIRAYEELFDSSGPIALYDILATIPLFDARLNLVKQFVSAKRCFDPASMEAVIQAMIEADESPDLWEPLLSYYVLPDLTRPGRLVDRDRSVRAFRFLVDTRRMGDFSLDPCRRTVTRAIDKMPWLYWSHKSVREQMAFALAELLAQPPARLVESEVARCRLETIFYRVGRGGDLLLLPHLVELLIAIEHVVPTGVTCSEEVEIARWKAGLKVRLERLRKVPTGLVQKYEATASRLKEVADLKADPIMKVRVHRLADSTFAAFLHVIPGSGSDAGNLGSTLRALRVPVDVAGGVAVAGHGFGPDMPEQFEEDFLRVNFTALEGVRYVVVTFRLLDLESDIRCIVDLAGDHPVIVG